MNAKMTTAQVAMMLSLRGLPAADASQARKDLFNRIKAFFGIPEDHKLKVELDNQHSPMYAVLVRKKDGSTYPLNATGTWTGSAGARSGYDAPRARHVVTMSDARTAILAAIAGGLITPAKSGDDGNVHDYVARSSDADYYGDDEQDDDIAFHAGVELREVNDYDETNVITVLAD